LKTKVGSGCKGAAATKKRRVLKKGGWQPRNPNPVGDQAGTRRSWHAAIIVDGGRDIRFVIRKEKNKGRERKKLNYNKGKLSEPKREKGEE